MMTDDLEDFERARPTLLIRIAQAFVFVWVPMLLVVTALLMAAHVIALPKPTVHDARLAGAIAASRSPATRGRWTALHILLGECRCSQRVLGRLIARGPRHDVTERILLVEASRALVEEGRRAGWEVESLARPDLQARYGVDAAPLLVVADPGDHLAYVGGFTAQKGSLAIQDVSIEDRLLAGFEVAALPLFGCPIDRERRLDPLGVRAVAKTGTP